MTDAAKEARKWGDPVKTAALTPDECRQAIELAGQFGDLKAEAGPVERDGKQRIVISVVE